MPVTQVRGVDISWSEQGAGPTLVVAHGLTGSRASSTLDWSVLTENFRVVQYDARGHGESGGAPDENDYCWNELAEDLLAVLDVIAPRERVHGIGISMGTATLIYAALAQPERFAGLVLGAVPTAYETRAAQAANYRAAADFVESQGLAALIEVSVNQARAPIFEDTPRPTTGPSVREEILPQVLRGAALSDLPPRAAVAELAVPSLVLAWDTDPGHPVSSAQEVHRLVRGAEMKVATTSHEISLWGRVASNFLLGCR